MDDREHWDQRYREGTHAADEPDALLSWACARFVAPAFPQGGAALDVAGGRGRNALWLAARGWEVTLVDISAVGLEQARERAGAAGLTLRLVERDLEREGLPPAEFDLVVVFFYLERTLFPALERALCPGGVLIYKTYTEEQLRFRRGPTKPEHLLKPGELRRAFPALEELHYRETVADEKATAELVARKK